MLEDTVAIVCGGGRGIGEATAKLMAEKGASVVVNDLGVDLQGDDEESEPAAETVQDIRDDGGEAMAHYGDVTSLDYTEQLVQDAYDEYGAVHSVANFAGIIRDSMVFTMEEDDWDAVIDVHLKGHFSLLRSTSSHWREQYKESEYERQRSFLAVSSAAAKGNPAQSNYASAKAGILGLMRSSARELDRYNVRVNAFWPGALTRMTETIPEEVRKEMSEEDFGPQLTAPLPAFIASEHAEDVTGCTFSLKGGELSFVSDPAEERTLEKDPIETGGWTPEDIAAQFDELTDGFETSNTDPVGM